MVKKFVGSEKIETNTDIDKSIDELSSDTRPDSEGRYSITNIYYRLCLTIKILDWLNGMKTTGSDQEAYEKTKRVIFSLRDIIQKIHELRDQERSINAIPYIKALQIEIQTFNLDIRGEKSLYVAEFFSNCLNAFEDIYLITPTKSDPFSALRSRAKTLNKNIESHPFLENTDYLPFNVLWRFITIHYNRLDAVKASPKTVEHDSMVTEAALNRLKAQSLRYLSLIIRMPNSYPLFIEKTQLLEDLLFDVNEKDYLILQQSGKLPDLYNSFAFNHPIVSTYFNQGSQNPTLADAVIALIEEEYAKIPYDNENLIKNDDDKMSDISDDVSVSDGVSDGQNQTIFLSGYSFLLKVVSQIHFTNQAPAKTELNELNNTLCRSKPKIGANFLGCLFSKRNNSQVNPVTDALSQTDSSLSI